MEPLSELISKRQPNPRKGGTERGELIEFFSLKMERTPRHIAVRLAHYTLSDLYALKSAVSDRFTRNGKDAAQKYFWWATKTTSV